MENQLHASPYDFFNECFGRAKAAALPQFDSMVLITATREAKPSGRVVLLKGVVRDRGFWFFTNYESRKASEILSNPNAQLLFYWPALGRQIRIEGTIERLANPDSDAYWYSRPRGSRIGALVSQQSQPLSSVSEMKNAVSRIEREWEGKEIPRPPNWGGFELVANYFEFWEDRADRLHERIVYQKQGDAYTMGRLWP